MPGITGGGHMAVPLPYEQADTIENITFRHYVAGGNYKCSSKRNEKYVDLFSNLVQKIWYKKVGKYFISLLSDLHHRQSVRLGEITCPFMSSFSRH